MIFLRPSFLSGIARLIDLGAQFESHAVCDTQAEADAADARAIYSDFSAVGEDLAWAMDSFENDGEAGE